MPILRDQTAVRSGVFDLLTNTTTPTHIWVAPGIWASVDKIAADPRRRAEALANAQKHRARRKYAALVKAFAEHDARTGATPLVTRAAREAPPKRICIKLADGTRRYGYADPDGIVRFGRSST